MLGANRYTISPLPGSLGPPTSRLGRDTAFGRSVRRVDLRHQRQPASLMPHIRYGESSALQPDGHEVSWRAANNEDNDMTIASDLLQQHIQTLVDDNARWQTLIADNILWELAYAPSLGHPAQLSGREEAVRHATWFVGAVENFRFFDLKVYALADPQGAVAEVKGEGLIKSTGRLYRQDYVVFLRAADGKIAFLREYFDPVRAAKALDTPILGLES